MFIFSFLQNFQNKENNKLRVFAAAFQEKLECLIFFGLHASGLLSKKAQWNTVLFRACAFFLIFFLSLRKNKNRKVKKKTKIQKCKLSSSNQMIKD